MSEPYDQYRNTSLIERGPGRLAIVPSAQAIRRDIFCMVVGAGGIALFGLLLIVGVSQGGLWVWVVGGGGTLGALALLAGGILAYRWRTRVEFDTGTGTAVERSGGLANTHALADVASIELKLGGPYSEEGHGFFGNETLTIETAQVVLRFRDGRSLLLSNHTDFRWSSKVSDRLARFLGVPLLNSIEAAP